jgi:ABC-2 type transport system permease protein
VVQALTFVLPVVFFSIFAMMFSNQSDPTSRIRVAVVDEDGSEYSTAIVEALAAEGGLDVRTTRGSGEARTALDRAAAEALVRDGSLPVAVILPDGLGEGHQFWGTDGTTPTVLVLADVSDPIAPQVVTGLLQKVSFTAAPGQLATDGLAMFEQYSGPLTEAQQAAVDTWLGELAAGGAGAAGPGAADLGLPTEIVNVMNPDAEGDTATISFYAAGIGVMFLLFSCAGAGGTLLEEEEAGTLERLIGSRAGMRTVLAGKWLFLWMMGGLQLTVMFVWGAVVFGLPLWDHVPGFVVMTAVTAAAAAAFGLVLATLSRSRAQLSGMSTIVILTMSALGGSMFPRFMMSETMQSVGLVTFNAWALDGYLKVFWYQAPLLDLWPQVLVLLALTGVFLGGARLLARRWEVA